VLNLLWALGGLALGFLILSITILMPNELAVIDRLGELVDVEGPGGIIVRPFLLYKLHRIKTDIVRITIPTTKEHIVKDDDVTLNKGQMRPLRINHKEARSANFWVHMDRTDPSSAWQLVPYSGLTDEEKSAIEGDAMQSAITTEVIAHIDITIGKLDPSNPKKYDKQSLYDFVRRVGTTKNAAARVFGTARSALVELLSSITARNAVDAQSQIESLIKTRLEIMVGEEEDPTTGQLSEQPLGINIRTVEIEEFELGKTVNQARAREAAAIADRKASYETTDAEAYKIREKGKADGDADRDRGSGRAQAIGKVAEAMANPEAKFAAILETTEKVSERAKFIIAPEIGGLAATIATIAQGTRDAIGKSLE
jgi:regulator of protease activity HflC (stomatin/prohibitin superfamily)